MYSKYDTIEDFFQFVIFRYLVKSYIYDFNKFIFLIYNLRLNFDISVILLLKYIDVFKINNL